MDPGPKDSCSSRPIPRVDHGPGGAKEKEGKLGGVHLRGEIAAPIPFATGSRSRILSVDLGGLFLPAGR